MPILKGLKILGITGTWQGWVPDSSTIYNAGSFGSGYSSSSITKTGSRQTITFEQTSIKSSTTFYRNGGDYAEQFGAIKIGSSINFVPYSTINITFSGTTRCGSYDNANSSRRQPKIAVYGTSGNLLASADAPSSPSPSGTATLNISSVNVNGYILLTLFDYVSRRDNAGVGASTNDINYIYKIWFT